MSTYSKIIINNKLLSLDCGIAGIRGQVGSFPITEKAFFCIGRSVAQICKKNSASSDPRVLILNDGRDSFNQLFKALCAGLIEEGLIPVNCGMLPTPAAPVLLDLMPDFALAIVISASHNSYEFNGIKIFSQSGNFSVDYGLDLNRIFTFFYQDFEGLFDTNFKIQDLSTQAKELYISSIVNKFKSSDFDGLPEIVVDCANGAASSVIEEILKKLGINAKIISNQPNGKNINLQTGSVFPNKVAEVVKEFGCSIGFCFDGDTDRVLCANKLGQIKDGDDFLALLAKTEQFKNGNLVVGTILSNSGLDLYLSSLGKNLIRSDVGELNIKNLMISSGSLLGGEPSGHILVGDHALSSDGIVNMLEILKAALSLDNLEIKTFNKFFSKLIAIPIKTKLSLDCGPVFEIVTKFQKILSPGRVFLRYSQTEPILRLFVESDDQHKGLEVSSRIESEVCKVFKN